MEKFRIELLDALCFKSTAEVEKELRVFVRSSHTLTLNHKVEKPIFMSLRGPKALDDKGHGTE